MKINLHIFYLLLSTLAFSACEKVVYFDVDTKENKLVVNGFIQPDSSANLIVALSVDPLAIGFENVRVEDASIRLYRNTIYIGDFVHSADGNYTIDKTILNAQPGDNFRMEASATGREPVSAETTIPSTVAIAEVKIIDTIFVAISYSTIDSLGNIYFIDTLVPHYKLQITFTDPAGDDFYSLKINYQDAYSETYTCFTTDDPVFTIDGDYSFGDNSDDGTVTLCDEVFFTDISFNGTTKSITLSLLEIPTEFVIDPKFVFRLNHVSEEYYKYLSTASLQSSNGDNPFGEPVIVLSNIVGGFGIFAGLNSSVAEIEL